MPKVAIMQPYFLPYLGYFQLASSVDLFVVYDDVQFTKKGWVTRNRLNSPEGPWTVSLPTKSAPVSTLIRDKRISSEFNAKKLMRRIGNSYAKSPHKHDAIHLMEKIFINETENLFEFLLNSLKCSFDFLGMDDSKVIVSSSIGDFRDFRGQNKVLAICEALGATSYVNPIGGRGLYNPVDFESQGTNLCLFAAEVEEISGAPMSFLHSVAEYGLESTSAKVRCGSYKLAD